jgi:glycosyltransferase involved in cell wall biosynthesis
MRGYDKWSAYLPFYERVMGHIKPGSTYLEIGVQNMGWLDQLDPGNLFTRCVACDINPAIAEHSVGTRFTDIVVGDSASEETFQKINNLELKFDLIVDDASHTQQNILANFMLYWPLLREDGHFMIEDCHTDFSPVFAQDNYFGISIYEFFSALTELSTLSSFNPALREKNAAYRTMRRFYPKSHCDVIADSVKSLSFANSCILINKGDPLIGERILRGDEWPVVPSDDLRAFTLDVLDSTIMHRSPELAVVYLNRAVTDNEKAGRERFISAYLRFMPVTPHQLYVVNKGFSPEQLQEQYILFKDLVPRFINIDDEGFDLTAYGKAALQIEEPITFFMNTHSEPLRAEWLDIVYTAFTSDDTVGLVGCTGNVETHHPFVHGFPEYPNYHVRSNGFMIRRVDYLNILTSRTLESKIDAYQFEAGRQSMTRMIQASGRQALVAGKKGVVSPGALWRSGIFRSWNQGNLLVGDNQTRVYQVASPFKKSIIWGVNYSRLSLLYPHQRLHWHAQNRPLRRIALRLRRQFRGTNFWQLPSLQIGTSCISEDDQVRSSRVAVLVPTHLDQLTDEVAATLLQNASQLHGYKLEVILPETCSPSWYEAFFAEHAINGTVRLVKPDFFGSAAAVNKMGTDPAFYRMYEEFDYILICHLDAWIFRDRLAFWMEQDYDFVGAPLFLPDNKKVHFLQRMAPFGGNGGLSLRKVASCIRVLDTFRPGIDPVRLARAVWFLARNRQWGFIRILFRLLHQLRKDWRGTCEKHNIYEDVFFTIIAPLCGNRISIPSSRTAMQFACEVNYPLMQKELFGPEPPMGIHGYDKYVDPEYLDYARGFFARKQKFYDGLIRATPPVVSVVMIVKELISSGRMETFEQAITSVIDQTYHCVEIVLLDGGSRDGTFEALQERYDNLSKVALHSQTDHSVWEAMSNGIELATGELVAFMNSDDYFCTVEALELMVQRMIETNADMVYGHTLLLTEQGPQRFPTNLPSVLNCFGIVHQATLFKKGVIQTIDPFRSGHITAENYLFVATLMAGFRITEVPEILVHYRTGGMSTDFYGGANFDRTIADYIRYMKKLTTVGHYLNDGEIRLLYGFIGLSELGLVRFVRMILKIRDQGLRRLLLRGTWNAAIQRAGRIKAINFGMTILKKL